MPEIDEPSGEFSCPSCGVRYTGWPGKHICPDGKTHSDRIRQPYPSREKPKLYIKQDILELTEEDKKLLKGMKVVP